MQIYDILVVKSGKKSSLNTPIWHMVSSNLKVYVVKRGVLNQFFGGDAVFRRDFHQISWQNMTFFFLKKVVSCYAFLYFSL